MSTVLKVARAPGDTGDRKTILRRPHDNFGFSRQKKITAHGPSPNETAPIMAKNKGKRSAGAESASGNGDVVGKNDTASANGETALPSLDESALANLTQKIEQKLQSGSGANKDSQKKPNNSPSSAKKKNKSKDSAQPPGGGGEQKANQGKKRDRNGDVIAREEKGGKNNKPSKKSEGDSKNDVLRQQILALGGSKEDFDLIANVDSESEAENIANGTKQAKGQPDEDSLRKELAKIMKDAGHVKPDDLKEQEDDEDEDENGGVEVEDLDKHTPPPPPTEATKDMSKKEPPAKKDSAKKDSTKDSTKKDATKDATKKDSTKKDSGKKQDETMPKEYSKLVCLPVPDDF